MQQPVKTYEECKSQLNLSVPNWQLDELTKRAKRKGIKRTELAHRIIAEWLEKTV